MRIQFEFDTHDYDLQAVNLARLLLDIQHMVVVSFALAKGPLSADDVVFDPYKQKYTWMIEAATEELGEAALTIVSINMASPLRIDFGFKELAQGVKEAFVRTFRYVINHLLFIDIERERRSVEVLLMREQVLDQRIRNFGSALDLAQKIPDEQLREEYINSLRSSVFPFAVEHPPIKQVKVIDEAAEDDDGKTEDKEIIDEADDESKPN